MITFTKMEKQRDLFTRRWRDVRTSSPKEHAMQIQLVSLLRWCLRPDVIMFHVPNGELRDKRAAAKLKAMGVLPGVADLVFLWKKYFEDSEGSHTAPGILFLELKLPGRKQTDEQVAFGLAARLAGADYYAVRSIDEALIVLKERDLLRSDREVYSRIPTR